MYIQRNTYWAAVGKNEDLRQLLQEAVVGYQADGIRIGLIRPVFGIAGEFTTVLLAETLAELHETRERILGGASYRTRVSQSIPLLATQPVSSLLEPLIPFPQDGSTNRITQRVILAPVPSKLDELRTILEERIRERIALGARISLARTVFAAELALVVNVSVPDYAELDALQERNRTDEFRAYQARVNAVLVRSPEITVNEAIVPVQPASVRELAGAATR